MDKLDYLEVLYKELEYAKSCLQPSDTGHIHTAIGWIEQRIDDLKDEIRCQRTL